MDNQTAPAKKLRRSTSDKMIAGVCGGLAEYLNIDPSIVRIVFVILALIGSGGFWIYIIMWLVVPEDTSTGTPVDTTPKV